MKTMKTNSTMPGAWIVNPKDKGRRSIKKGNVYLQNGEEFEIEIFNPLKKSILTDIRLNGESISTGGLVLKPGQRCYLDCFIDDKRKFKFETYNIDNSKEAKDATSDNGMLEIFFYKEDVIQFNNWRDFYHKRVIKEYYPIYIERYPWYYPYYPHTFGGSFGSSCYGGSANCVGNSNNTVCYSNSSGTGGSGCTATTTALSIGANYNTVSQNQNYFSSQVETGRVEKGPKSEQNFHEIDMNFEKNYIHSLVYRLLPESQKPVLVKRKKDKEVDMTELLYKLSELKKAGILTEEEFSDKKKEILNRI